MYLSAFLLPCDVCLFQRFFGGVVYVLSSVMCLLTDFWSSSFDLLLPFCFLHVSLTLFLPPSLCLDMGLHGGLLGEEWETEDECGEVKGRKGRTDMGHRVTSSRKEYCRHNMGSFMVSFLG